MHLLRIGNVDKIIEKHLCNNSRLLSNDDLVFEPNENNFTQLHLYFVNQQLCTYLMREPGHEHGIPGELAHVAGAELPHLRRDAVLLHQRLLEAKPNG